MASQAKSPIRLGLVDEQGGGFRGYVGRYDGKLFTLFWIALAILVVEFFVIGGRYIVLVDRDTRPAVAVLEDCPTSGDCRATTLSVGPAP
ncbi:hypothetical protein [Nitrospira sp. KM1]|uniref:hypothetical protein n=1 Tax=Nitrospira sp. KM1 TaxID=1936990 RepID=UPI0015641A83|nr:hypothetical protein [Nitrospira sp. KM1]